MSANAEARTEMLPDPWARISVVFVVHNSASVIADTLDNLKQATDVVIVDNQSSDGTPEMAERLHPGVRVIRRDDNLGLTIASNQGFREATRDYVLHLNPDTRFDTACIARLVQTMDENPNCAVVGPLLYNNRDVEELDVMGPSELRHAKIAVDPDGPFCTWFVTGAVCLWRRSALDAMDGFDENIFLYYEDADLCLRCAKAGWSLIIEPRADGHHYGGQSEAMSDKTRWRKDWNMAWGHLYFEAKHGDAAATRQLARSLLVGHAWSAFLGLLTFRRKRVVGQAARVAGIWRFLSGRPSWGRLDLKKG